MIKYKINIIFIIILISIYHYFINNGLEKIFTQTFFNYFYVKRPLPLCNKELNFNRLFCIGMPSGHSETFSVFSFLLYFYKFIPFWLCLIIILLISIQRVFSKMHTIYQVIIGCFLGFIYSIIYKKFNLSIIGFLIVFLIGFTFALLSMLKIDALVNGYIPYWVDKNMIENIKKKQNAPFYIKISSLYINSIIQDYTYISWNELEKYLDIIINNIKKSGINYDAVVGIKTGGAIISDYISLKLNLPNYKIKLSRNEYNCDKKSSDTINDIIKKNIIHDFGEFNICEKINDNLEGKNIILIDELVSSGTTIENAYAYLKNYKFVNYIYPTCISFYDIKYKGKININYVFKGTVFIWPWGYDN
jgi:hypoxanthine phosphoribosyltransferase